MSTILSSLVSLEFVIFVRLSIRGMAALLWLIKPVPTTEEFVPSLEQADKACVTRKRGRGSGISLGEQRPCLAKQQETRGGLGGAASGGQIGSRGNRIGNKGKRASRSGVAQPRCFRQKRPGSGF